MAELQVGDRAPDFELLDGEGKTVKLADFQGKRVILYFYPRDNTPGCTKEACGFRDRQSEFAEKNTVILGVSGDDAKSHGKFTNKFDLNFPLLCDTENKVAEAYGSYGLKKFMGREFMGTFRHTFVIAPNGTLEKIYRKVKAEPHPAQVLEDLAELPPVG